MARVLKENKVLVTVYSERQTTRLSANRRYKQDGANKAATKQWKQDTARKGYNRRAEILKYSQRLRESARSPASSQIHIRPDPVSSKNKDPIAKEVAINLIKHLCVTCLNRCSSNI